MEKECCETPCMYIKHIRVEKILQVVKRTLEIFFHTSCLCLSFYFRLNKNGYMVLHRILLISFIEHECSQH